MNFARFFLVLGVIFIVIGGVMYLIGRLEIPFGRLPGDIKIESNNLTCTFALGTSILLSILLTILLNVIVRMLNK